MPPQIPGRISGMRVKVDGGQQLLKTLKNLGLRFPRKIISQSSRLAAKPVQRLAKSYAPKRSGTMARNIRVRALRKSRVSAGTQVRTGTRKEMGLAQKGNSYYPAAIEYGWVPKHSRSRRKIPGVRFMRRAWLGTRPEAARIFLNEMRKRMAQEARTLRRTA